MDRSTDQSLTRAVRWGSLRPPILLRWMGLSLLSTCLGGTSALLIARLASYIIHSLTDPFALYDAKFFYAGVRAGFLGHAMYSGVGAPPFADVSLAFNMVTPLSALVFLPVALLPFRLGMALWDAASVLLLVWTLSAIWTVLPLPRSLPARAVVMVAAFAAFPVLDSLWLGTWGPLLAWAEVLCWFHARRAHHCRAGAFLALALAVRWQCGLLVVLFLLRGQWRVLLSCALTLLAGVGIAAAVFGPASFPACLHAVLAHTGNPLDGRAYDGSLWAVPARVAALVAYLGVPGLPWREAGLPLAALCSFLLVAAICLRIRSAAVPFDQALALCIIGGLLVVPHSWMHYDTTLFLPLAIIARVHRSVVAAIIAFWLGAATPWLVGFLPIVGPATRSLNGESQPLLVGCCLSVSVVTVLVLLWRMSSPRLAWQRETTPALYTSPPARS